MNKAFSLLGVVSLLLLVRLNRHPDHICNKRLSEKQFVKNSPTLSSSRHYTDILSLNASVLVSYLQMVPFHECSFESYFLIENALENFATDLQNSFVLTSLYDIVKFILAYLTGRYLVSRYNQWKYGGWKLIVKEVNSLKNKRNISVAFRERIEDENELSVFVKGVVSPYAHLNLDIVSDKSKNIGLFTIDKRLKTYTVDLAKNPTIEELPDHNE